MAASSSPAALSPARVARIAIAIGLTAYLLWRADPAEVLRAASRADWRWIAAAVTLLFVDRTLMAYRWMVLLSALTPGSRPPFRAILRIFFVSTFVGTFLPSVGGDLYRAYSLSRLRVSGVEAAASVLMDRVLGVMSIVLLGIAALVPGPDAARNPWILLTLGLASIGCVVAALAVFSSRTALAGQALAARLPGARGHRAAGLPRSVRRVRRRC